MLQHKTTIFFRLHAQCRKRSPRLSLIPWVLWLKTFRRKPFVWYSMDKWLYTDILWKKLHRNVSILNLRYNTLSPTLWRTLIAQDEKGLVPLCSMIDGDDTGAKGFTGNKCFVWLWGTTFIILLSPSLYLCAVFLKVFSYNSF